MRTCHLSVTQVTARGGGGGGGREKPERRKKSCFNVQYQAGRYMEDTEEGGEAEVDDKSGISV